MTAHPVVAASTPGPIPAVASACSHHHISGSLAASTTRTPDPVTGAAVVMVTATPSTGSRSARSRHTRVSPVEDSGDPTRAPTVATTAAELNTAQPPSTTADGAPDAAARERDQQRSRETHLGDGHPVFGRVR